MHREDRRRDGERKRERERERERVRGRGEGATNSRDCPRETYTRNARISLAIVTECSTRTTTSTAAVITTTTITTGMPRDWRWLVHHKSGKPVEFRHLSHLNEGVLNLGLKANI